MSTKKWLLGAIGGMLLAGAATAQASETIEIRLTKIDGKTLSTLTDTQKADFTSVPTATGALEAISVDALKAHEYQLDIYAKVFGANDASNDDGTQSLVGNIAVGKGSIVVTPAGSKPKDNSVLAVVGFNPFHDSGAKNGKAQTWGMGSAPSISADDYVVLRAASAQVFDWGMDANEEPTIPDSHWKGNGAPGAGMEIKVGSFKMTFADFQGKTDVSWGFQTAPDGSRVDQAGLWVEDGSAKDALSGQLISVGYGFAVVPEPAGLSVLALGALGLLARRRK